MNENREQSGNQPSSEELNLKLQNCGLEVTVFYATTFVDRIGIEPIRDYLQGNPVLQHTAHDIEIKLITAFTGLRPVSG